MPDESSRHVNAGAVRPMTTARGGQDDPRLVWTSRQLVKSVNVRQEKYSQRVNDASRIGNLSFSWKRSGTARVNR